MKMVSIKDNSKQLKFKNLEQAAAWFAFTDIASSKESARINLKAAMNGWQNTGATDSGIENRHSAYGYIIKK